MKKLNTTKIDIFFYSYRVPVEIYFTPNTDKEVNFNMVCHIKRKTLPLSLNVKAEGYSMNCMLLHEDKTGNKVELTDRDVNNIYFGEVGY